MPVIECEAAQPDPTMPSTFSLLSLPLPAAAPSLLSGRRLNGNLQFSASNHGIVRRSKKLSGILKDGKPNSWCRAELADFAQATAATYGALLFSGGLFAFTRSGSKGSLYGGITASALMASAYILMQAPENKAAGYALGFGSAFLFSSVFGIRLAATRKLVPSGALLALSLSALAVFISAYLESSA